MTVETPNLIDYGKDEYLPEYAEFSQKYEFSKMYRTCLSLQFNNQYPRARKTFYDSMSFFAPLFDYTFSNRCNTIISKYDSPDFHSIYTYEQIEQLKFIRIVSEFSRLVLDASSKNRVKLNQDPTKRVEMIPVGYPQIVDYDHMSIEFFNKIVQVQKQYHHREIFKFFNHGLAWFAGAFDAKFVMQGYLLYQVECSSELRYRKLLIAFSKLLSRKGVSPTPYATLVYKPNSMKDIPLTVEDVVRAKRATVEEEPFIWLPDFTINSTL